MKKVFGEIETAKLTDRYLCAKESERKNREYLQFRL